MILGGEALVKAFTSGTFRAFVDGKLVDDPTGRLRIGPNSVDVSLGRVFLRPKVQAEVADPFDPASLDWEEIEVGEEGIVLGRGHDPFLLGTVRERFEVDDALAIEERLTTAEGEQTRTREAVFAPFYEGRSTCGRLGIASHVTAGFGDYQFRGAFTLELFTVLPAPIRLYPGMRIGQVSFCEIYQPSRYEGAYSGTNHYERPVRPALGRDRFLS